LGKNYLPLFAPFVLPFNHSSRSDLTGLATAARIACQLTVSKMILPYTPPGGSDQVSYHNLLFMPILYYTAMQKKSTQFVVHKQSIFRRRSKSNTYAGFGQWAVRQKKP